MRRKASTLRGTVTQYRMARRSRWKTRPWCVRWMRRLALSGPYEKGSVVSSGDRVLACSTSGVAQRDFSPTQVVGIDMPFRMSNGSGAMGKSPGPLISAR